MRKFVFWAVVAVGLSGCAAHHAEMNYIKATNALNQCLLAHPGMPAACQAELAVQQNDLTLYSNLSD